MVVRLPRCFRCKEHHDVGECPQDGIVRHINSIHVPGLSRYDMSLAPSALSPSPPIRPAFAREPPRKHKGIGYAMNGSEVVTKGMLAARIIMNRDGRSDEQLAVDCKVGITLIRLCKRILAQRPNPDQDGRTVIEKIASGEITPWEVRDKIINGTR